MNNHHRLIYTGWGVIGAVLIYITNNAHAILPLIPARYQAAFGALVAFLVTIRALNSTPPEMKSPPSSPSSPSSPTQPSPSTKEISNGPQA